MHRLLACLVLSAAAVAGEAWPGGLDGLGFAWSRGDALISFPTGDYTALCRLSGRSWLGANLELETDGGHAIANEEASRAVITQARTAGRFSFEAMIDIQGTQTPQAWVASFQAEQGAPQFVLSLDAGRIGVGATTAPVPAAPFHLLVQVDRTRTALWIDGTPAAQGTGADLAAWTPQQHLTFGAAWDGSHAFRGRLRQIAAGARAITDAAAPALAARARAAFAADRIEPTRLTFTGTVAEIGGEDEEAAANYVRQLWLFQYRDVAAVSGTHPAKTIAVYRFGRLDKKPAPGVADAQPGAVHTLTVIPWAQARGVQYEGPCRTSEQEDDVFIEVGR